MHRILPRHLILCCFSYRGSSHCISFRVSQNLDLPVHPVSSFIPLQKSGGANSDHFRHCLLIAVVQAPIFPDLQSYNALLMLPQLSYFPPTIHFLYNSQNDLLKLFFKSYPFCNHLMASHCT